VFRLAFVFFVFTSDSLIRF